MNTGNERIVAHVTAHADDPEDVERALIAYPGAIRPLFVAIFGDGCCAGRLAMASEIGRFVRLGKKRRSR